MARMDRWNDQKNAVILGDLNHSIFGILGDQRVLKVQQGFIECSKRYSYSPRL